MSSPIVTKNCESFVSENPLTKTFQAVFFQMIEIKVSNSFPLGLVKALSSEEMRMRPFSKYGNEYKMFSNDFESDISKEINLK